MSLRRMEKNLFTRKVMMGTSSQLIIEMPRAIPAITSDVFAMGCFSYKEMWVWGEGRGKKDGSSLCTS